MPTRNQNISKIFNKVADLLELEGANEYRIISYRTAAQHILDYSNDIQELYEQNALQKIDGVGEQLEKKITEIIETGELEQVKHLEEKIPNFLKYLLEETSLGPKRLQTLYLKLNIHNKKDLQKALKSDKIEKLDGFGEKTIKELQQLE